MSAVAALKPTVHVLYHGRVLCGAVHGLPRDWDAAHRWVSAFDGSCFDHATCATCREQLTLLRLYDVP